MWHQMVLIMFDATSFIILQEIAPYEIINAPQGCAACGNEM